jgi:hypothetical protein
MLYCKWKKNVPRFINRGIVFLYLQGKNLLTMKSSFFFVLLCLTMLSTKAQNLILTNPPVYPYGANIKVDYEGQWVREFSLSYGSTKKMLAFGVFGNSGNAEYGFIGGNTTAESPYQSPWMVFKDDGNVGIGTINPGTYKLAVEGTIGARKVKVTSVNPWPDFVFGDNYKLLTIPEMEKYVQQHRHLPEIPSAKEVALEGIELGEMNRKLLQKIEEQALYIIELNKRLSKLEAKQ